MRGVLFFALALVAAAGPATTARAENLGRLFFAPEQRTELDARRRARVPDKPAAAAETPAPTLRVHGLVQRSDGHQTVWIDGQPSNPGEARVSVVTRGRMPGRLAVTLEGRPEPIEIEVGATLERDTGRVRTLLGEGAVLRTR